MRIEVVAVVTIATSGCGQVATVANHDAATTDTTTAVDAPPPGCDRTKPFATPTQVPGIHDSNADDVHGTLTRDEHEYFTTAIYADLRSRGRHLVDLWRGRNECCQSSCSDGD